MNKEKELLQKFVNSRWVYDDWCLLKAEAEELLTQPEQTEQEPVAWAIFFDDEPNKAINEYLSQYKEDLEVIMQGGFCDEDMATLCPLYKSPPKREPLDDKKLTKLWRREVEMSNLEIEYDEFAGIVREIEKAYGIGV